MADPDFKFRRQHRRELIKLLEPAKPKCKQLCIVLELSYKQESRPTNEDLYMIVIDRIISKGVSKQQLIDALDSIGHGGLAEDFENETSIQDNEKGIRLYNKLYG